MVDTALMVKMYLLQDAALKSMLGTYKVVRGDLPAKFNPVQNLGPAISVSLHEGKAHEEVTAIRFDRVRIRVWAGKNDYARAWNIYKEVCNWMTVNRISVSPYGFIISSSEESSSEVTDPGPGESLGWATVNSIYLVEACDS